MCLVYHLFMMEKIENLPPRWYYQWLLISMRSFAMARRILLCVQNTAVYFVSVWNWLCFWQVKDGGKMIILSLIFSQLWLDITGPIRYSEVIYFLFWIHNNILDIISKYLIDRSYISWDIRVPGSELKLGPSLGRRHLCSFDNIFQTAR